jgi:anti-anti-sigma factor
VLHIWGDEDRATSGQRRPALSAAITCARDVVVDLRELHFADSSVMVDLAVLASRLRAEGRRLRLRGPQPQIQRLIEIVRLDRQPAVQLDA